MYHPTPTSTTDCTVGGLYSDSSEAGIFICVNQDGYVDAAGDHGECADHCNRVVYACVQCDSWGRDYGWQNKECGTMTTVQGGNPVPYICPSHKTKVINGRNYHYAACFSNDFPDLYCELGWGNVHGYNSYTPGCWGGNYYPNPTPPLSALRTEIGSLHWSRESSGSLDTN